MEDGGSFATLLEGAGLPPLYASVRADMAPGCNGRDTDVLACNMTAKVAPLMVKVREGVEFVRNTTALPAQLLL